MNLATGPIRLRGGVRDLIMIGWLAVYCQLQGLDLFKGLDLPKHHTSRAANLSHELTSYFTGNWSTRFEVLTESLRADIITVNTSRINPEVAMTLTSWIQKAAYHLKEWAGMGALGICVVFLCVLCLCCLRRLIRQRANDQMLMVQAFMAIEAGQSPNVWLAAMEKQ